VRINQVHGAGLSSRHVVREAPDGNQLDIA
jgi:hypothetical protein